MNSKSFLATLPVLILTAFQSITAQTEIQISTIKCYNLGDGRYFCQDTETKKPLQGSSRIIDGYTAQYTEAVFKDGIPGGSWKTYKYNKLFMECTYDNGILEGPYKEYYEDGSVKVSHNYVKGKPHGKFLQYDSNDRVESETSFKDGLQDGPDIRYDREGNIRTQTDYAAGKPVGKEIKNYEDYVHTANYNKDGKYDGEYSEIFTNGNVKEKGKYINGKKDGAWEYGKKTGQKTHTYIYANDEKIKETIYYNDNTVEVVRELKNGKKNGWERRYSFGDGGLKSEIFYKDGEVSSENGSATPVKQTRQITSNIGNYVRTFYEINGKYEGEITEQWMNGTKGMKAKGQYKNGKKTGHWVYENEYGLKTKEENYLDDKLDGTCITYSSKGKPYEIYQYTKGEKNGPYKLYRYNEDGLRETGTCVAGRAKGIRKYYDKNGNVTEERDVQ